MNSHDLQKRIQEGDRDAFRELYAVCGQAVYTRAFEALGNAKAARDTVKQVFLNLHHEIIRSSKPLDVDARLAALTDAEVSTQRLLAGDFFPVPTAAAPAKTPVPAASVPEPAPAAKTPEAPIRPVPETIEEAFLNATPYRPPLERAETYMQADGAKPQQQPRKAKPPRKQSGNAVITVLIIIFLLMFLWVLAGILMDFAILPRIDLGFQWFNDTIFPLFNLD